ncbi:YetF domain-containing protein [Clostridium thermarum]|uniref:YetF domain-containing protein n=1 Tax=Clostridium thermarum TaxID=1716543 RepID=UPI0013D25A17
MSLRKIFNHSAVTIVKNGEILYEGLKKARISIDMLLEELREAKVEDVNKVALAFWEADGKVSVFLDPQYEPITPSLYQMKTEPFDLPRINIKEGKIDFKELERVQKDESWLVAKLRNLYQTEVQNVLLATIDSKGKLSIFLKS